MKIIVCVVSLCIYVLGFAQNDSVKKINFSIYSDLYYAYDISNPFNNERPNFIYNHKKHNELNINLLLARVQFEHQNIRSNIGLMLGNYAQYNLASEPSWAQFVYEANIGIKLSQNHELWLDAGIMPSHIGFESAISADCWTLTRSILAENSPYYESGLKLSYTNKNKKWYMAILGLNGWQRITKISNSALPSAGLQITYKPSEKLTVNYSNFIGDVGLTNTSEILRNFHNFYLQYQASSNFGLLVGFDVGSDQINKKNAGTWLSPVLLAKYNFTAKWTLALRSEYYQDPNQLIISTGIKNGFKVFGLSSNLDFQLNQYAIFRIEAKAFQSPDPIFNVYRYNNYVITSNLSLKF